MKPILLKLSGLQSYREQQEIDFTTLCETGLFGIFGPTGSGKSTVLDAITLALYGKVERAQNGTQGILNHSEDAVFVSFSFELLSDVGTHQYRVERRFKRTGEHTVSNSMSRFIECLADGDRVIADKLGDVTRCVEDYIGLKMDDFTRAVVLPQGKFAEFLSLKGSDRRQMLQRLFHLEKYGDRLMQKLSQRVKDTDNRLDRLAAEQTGLGDASADAVKVAKERLQQAAQEAEQLRQRLQEVTIRLEKLGKVRELIHEQSLLQQRLEQLSGNEDAIAALEQQWEAAVSAQTLLPLLDGWKQMHQQSQQEQQRADELHNQWKQAEQASVHATEQEQQARQQLNQHEPRLLSRLEQLQQALTLQKECRELEQAQLQLHQQLEQIAAQLNDAQQQAQREQALLDKAQALREELNTQLRASEVRSQDRRELQEAQQRLNALDTARSRFKELEHEQQAQQSAASRYDATWEQLEQENIRFGSEEQHLFQQATSLQSEQQHQEQILLQFQQQLQQWEQSHHAASREAETHRLATVLAAQLQDGEPCAVCGSVHHPHPASLPQNSEQAPTEQEQDALQVIEQLQQSAREHSESIRSRTFELRTLLTDWEWLHSDGSTVEAYSHTDAASTQAQTELAEQDRLAKQDPYNTEFAGSYASLAFQDKTDVNSMQKEATNWLNAYVAQTSDLEQRIHQLRQQLRNWRQQQRDWSQRRTALQAERQSAQRLLEQSRNRLEATQQQTQQLLQDWQQHHPELTEQQARERFADLTRLDEQADQIRGRLEKSAPYIEERSQAIRQYEQQINTLERQQIQERTRYEGDQRYLQEKQNLLQQWIGEQSAEQLITEANNELNQYRHEATQWAERLRSAQQLHQQAGQHHALAVQSAQSLSAQSEQAAQRWQQALEQSRFDDEHHVAAARMDEQQLQAARQRIDSHREQQRELSVHLRELESKLDGQTVSEEQWQQLQQEWQETRQADEAALEYRARATRDFEDLEQRHVRWLELERQRTELAVESNHLSKLQASMRGNAFVEYIAEEQLMQVSLAASERLRFLTRQRYSLEVDSGGGFVICDNGNGGIRRPVSTLSGGETFLTSLSLALALSAQIQLRGQYPLQFFFLDEGFGTLDPELLDTVVTSLEKLHTDRLSVGIISHVPELRMRLPRKLVVVPAEQAGVGSRVVMETM
ncbi:AAA family ATPase [Paenibacillus sp. WLX2291]|uniref:AAA family ATPase n=1 Tax=Paenibacillus sp. WLX2291 TaxID=3296934 RepID=UPI0039843495